MTNVSLKQVENIPSRRDHPLSVATRIGITPTLGPIVLLLMRGRSAMDKKDAAIEVYQATDLNR